MHRKKPYGFFLCIFVFIFSFTVVTYSQSSDLAYKLVLNNVLDAHFTEIPQPNIGLNNKNQCHANTAILIGKTIQSIAIGTENIIDQTRQLIKYQLASPYLDSYDEAIAQSCSSMIDIIENEYFAAAVDVYKLYKILKNNKSSLHRAEMNELARFLNLLYTKMPSSITSFLVFSGIKPLQIELNIDYNSNELAHLITLFSDVVFNHRRVVTTEASNTLSKILKANYFLKNEASQHAIYLLETIDTTRNSFPLLYYLKGQAYLYIGNYRRADYYYSKFLYLQSDGNFVKSSFLRKKWISTILQEKEEAFDELILQRGKAILYTDKQAVVEATKEYNSVLLQARILFDGGEYQKAMVAMDLLNVKALTNKDLVEYYYRYGRIFQQMKKYNSALFYYSKVFKLPNTVGYFHKKSALESGRILLIQNEFNLAEKKLKLVYEIKSDSYSKVMDSEADVLLNEIVDLR